MHFVPLTLSLGLVGIALTFFSTDIWMPIIKSWKSRQIMATSNAYLEESIRDSFLKLSLSNAHLATLLDPENDKIEEHYLNLLFEDNPQKAIQERFRKIKSHGFNHKFYITALEEICIFLETTKAEKKHLNEVFKVGNEYSQKLFGNINQSDTEKITDQITKFYLLSGNSSMAESLIQKSMERGNFSAQTLFNASQLAYQRKSLENLSIIISELNKISNEDGDLGINAIRHLVLLNSIYSFSSEEINNWLKLLRQNDKSEKIDFLRVFTIIYALQLDEDKKKRILSDASSIFNLEKKEELSIFCRWLMKIEAVDEVTQYLPQMKARLDEDLFVIRSNALIRLERFEQLETELENAPIVHTRWLLTVEARIQSMSGNIKEAETTLDRLYAFLENDTILLRNTVSYFEKSKDFHCFFYFLKKIKKITVHKKYALNKLLIYGSSSATLNELIEWTNELVKIDDSNIKISQANLYFRLLNPSLQKDSKELNDLIKTLTGMNLEHNNFESKINMALAHLRNGSNDLALSALEKNNEWLNWENKRPAWKWIISKILEKNQIDRVSFSQENLLKKMSRAERESLELILPNIVRL